MRAKNAVWMMALWLVSAIPVWGAQASTSTWESLDNELQTDMQASEAKGAAAGRTDSLGTPLQPVTPLTEFPEKPPFEQALSELAQALDLFKAGRFEHASDVALEAYDDFSGLGRVPKVKRSEIREKKRQAAGIYVESSISYVKNYLKRANNAPEALEEARYRLEDLRDVAREYSELKKMLNSALQELPTPPHD